MHQNKLFEGSSKIFYDHDHDTYLMSFKDDVHGGGLHDKIRHTGDLRKRFTYAFYQLLEQHGIKTHLAQSHKLGGEGIIVQKLKPIKIEVLVRNVARGHWVDSHKVPLFDGGIVFDEPIVELCLKIKATLEDERVLDDPRINEDLAVSLNKYCKYIGFRGKLLQTKQEFDFIKQLALKINKIYAAFMSQHGRVLEDFKFEIGVRYDQNDAGPREFILIDEISPDCSRIRDALGNSLSKDLFRQKKSKEEIYEGYKKLTEGIEEVGLAKSDT